MTDFSSPNSGPQFDNPIYHIMNNVLGNKGQGSKNLSQYLNRVVEAVQQTHLSSTLLESDLPYRTFLKKVDKYGIGANLDKLRRVPLFDQGAVTSEASGILTSLFGSQQSNRSVRNLVNALTTTSRNVGATPLELLYDANASALFYGAQDMGYFPVPVMSQGILSRGYKKSVITPHAFTDYIGDIVSSLPYSYGAETLASQLVSKNKNLNSLLRPQPRINGVSSLFTDITSAFGRLHTTSPGLDTAIRQRANASGLINIMTRSGRIPSGVNPGGLNTLSFFRETRRELEAFPERFLEELNQLDPNLANYYHYIKPEYYLGGGKAIQLPNYRFLSSVFGNLTPTKSMLEKGFHQIFKRAELQPRHIARLGTKAFPRYITQGRKDFAKSIGRDTFMLQGLPLKIGVIDFETALHSRLSTQESGTILTRAGESIFAQALPKSRVELGASDPATIAQIEKLFGVNLPLDDRVTLDRPFSFNVREFTEAIEATPEEWKVLLKEGNITPEQRLFRKLFRRRGTYHSQTGSLLSANNSRITSAQVRGDKVIIDFSTTGGNVLLNNLAPAMELEVSGRRETAVFNKEYEKTAALAEKMGVHLLVPRDEFFKMMPEDILLSTFMDNTVLAKDLSRNTRRKIRSQIRKRLPGMSVENISVWVNNQIKQLRRKTAVIKDNDVAGTVAEIRAMLTDWSSGSEGDSLKQIADKVIYGEQLTLDSAVKTQLGIRSITMFSASGGLRSDFMGDINPMKGARLTASKALMLAQGTRLLGFNKPTDSPLFNLIHKKLSGGNIAIDPDTFMVSLKEGAPIRRAMQAIAGIGLEAPGRLDEVVRIGKDGLSFRGSTLNKIPLRANFRHRAGGVRFGDLEHTLLDKNMPDLLFLDLGKPVEINVGGHKRPIRYVPFMKNYLRTNKGQGGRLTVNTKDVAEPFLYLINKLEHGISTDNIQQQLSDYIGKFIASIPRQAGSKRGRLEDVETINISSAFRARLTAQRGGATNISNVMDLDSLFDIRMSRSAFEDYVTRRKYKDPETTKNILEQMRTQGYVDVLLTADPTQRPEHQLYTRLRIDPKAEARAKLGQFDVSMNPLLFRLLERDVDRDVATLFPLLGFGDYKPGEMDEQLARQTRAIRPFVYVHHLEMLKNKSYITPMENKIKEFMHGTLDFLGVGKNSFTSFLSQKQQAHFGYTISRAVDRWMDTVITADEAVLGGFGIEEKAIGLVSDARRAFDKDFLGAATALRQSIFQGGVKKGIDSPLLDLAESLVGLRETALEKNMTFQQIQDAGYNIVSKFLTQTDTGDVLDDSLRTFMASDYLLLRHYGSRDAVDKVLGGLEEGLKMNSQEAISRVKEIRGILQEQAARVLGASLGVGYALQPHIKNKPKNLRSVLEDTLYPGTDTIKKVAGTILETSDIDPGIAPELDEVTDAIGKAKEAKDIAAKTKGLQNIIKNNKKSLLYGSLAGIATLALGGVASSFAGSPLPPPIDVSQPQDTGPNLEGITRVFSPTQGIQRRSMGNRQYSDIMKANTFPSTTNVHFIDEYGSRNDFMLDKQLNRQLYSDF